MLIAPFAKKIMTVIRFDEVKNSIDENLKRKDFLAPYSPHLNKIYSWHQSYVSTPRFSLASSIDKQI
jgi:transposase